MTTIGIPETLQVFLLLVMCGIGFLGIFILVIAWVSIRQEKQCKKDNAANAYHRDGVGMPEAPRNIDRPMGLF